MSEWELLAAIDHEMMQIDINLMEWQGNLDMAALAGVGVPFELWTDDDPPVRITASNIKETVVDGTRIRVMHWDGSKFGEVGLAAIDINTGVMMASIKDKVFDKWVNAMDMMPVRPPENLSYQDLITLAGSGAVELPTPNLNHLTDPENHPFFKENTND